ncbi:MAG: transporter substrate-binding protein [Fimbriiglobus sp.]
MPSSPEETAAHHHLHSEDSMRPKGSSTGHSLAMTSDWVGKKLGKYTILKLLGQGGMGIVYQGHDPAIDRAVALKVLASATANDSTALTRFQAEARAIGRIQHSNVAAIYEVGQDQGVHFLAMEFLAGGSLEGRPLTVYEATTAMIDACRGVGAAHAAGMIHRDIKPANILRAADNTVKVTDFGLAKSPTTGASGVTQNGLVVGTPCYMSPEQCEARPIDARSDVYALGGTYYTLLTGRTPYYDVPSITQIMYAHCHGPVPDPLIVNPTLPPACAAIVAKAMAKDPSARYPNTSAMLADLETVAITLSGRTLSLSLSTPPQRVPEKTSSRLAGALFMGGVLLLAAVTAIVFSKPWRSEAPGVAADAQTTIKIGVLHSLTGPMASSTSPVADATVLAIEEINAEGGLLGAKLVPVVVDGQTEPENFAREAERLIVEEKVSVIFGCWTSASRKTVRPVFEKHDHLLLYPVQFEGLELSPNIFYFGSAPNQQIIPAVEWAVKSLGKKTFFLVGSDYVFPHAANEIIKDQLKRLGGSVVGEAYIGLEHPNLEPVITAIAKSKPDMILNTINGDANVGFFRNLRRAGITSAQSPTMSFSIGEQGLRALVAKDITGEYAAWTYFSAIDTPENADFVRRMRARHPLHGITDPMEAAYVSVKMWGAAAKEAGTFDPKAVRRALLNQRMAAPSGPTRIDAQTQYVWKTPRIGQVQPNGRMGIVMTAEAPVEPLPFPRTRPTREWQMFLTDLHRQWGDRWSAPES